MDIPGRLQTGASSLDAFAHINRMSDTIEDQARTKIIRDGVTPTLIFGYHKGEYVLKIAKEGVDVTTATDDELAFSSAFSYLKVLKEGVVTVPSVAAAPSGGVTVGGVDVDLGETTLTYSPLHIASYKFTSSGINMSGIMPFHDIKAQSNTGVIVSSTETFAYTNNNKLFFNVRVRNYDTVATSALQVRYRIYQAPGF